MNNKMKDLKVYHLSHNDCDGYGAQLLTSQVKFYSDIEFFNSGYGDELEFKLREIKIKINKEYKEYKRQLLLITDLNLTLRQASVIDNVLDNDDVEIVLLDHHLVIDGINKIYDWYKVDRSSSGTQLTYDFLKKLKLDKESSRKLEEFKTIVKAIDAADLYKTNSDYFQLGRTIVSLLSSCTEISETMFIDKSIRTKYRIFVLQKINEEIVNKLGSIFINGVCIRIENNIINYKKEFFLNGEDIRTKTLSDSAKQFICKYYTENSSDYIHYFKGHKTFVVNGMTFVSDVSNCLLKHLDIDIVMNVTRKGVRLTSSDVNVRSLAEKYLSGGGHMFCSGGSNQDVEETFNYNDFIKECKDKGILDRE